MSDMRIDTGLELFLSTEEGMNKSYDLLEHKPKINGVELVGDKSTKELRIDMPEKVSELVNDAGYQTQQQVEEGLAMKQDTLESGVNLKTVDGQSLLGNGDIKAGLPVILIANNSSFQDVSNAVLSGREVRVAPSQSMKPLALPVMSFTANESMVILRCLSMPDVGNPAMVKYTVTNGGSWTAPQYTYYTTKTYVDDLIGQINTVLEAVL